jgi:hypothetical protein
MAPERNPLLQELHRFVGPSPTPVASFGLTHRPGLRPVTPTRPSGIGVIALEADELLPPKRAVLKGRLTASSSLKGGHNESPLKGHL